MRSIKRDLEQQHTALTDSIKSLGATRDAERGREIVKDPFGAASMTHDEEVAATVAEHRARQRKQVGLALEDLKAGPLRHLSRVPRADRQVATQGDALRHALRGVPGEARRTRARRVGWRET